MCVCVRACVRVCVCACVCAVHVVCISVCFNSARMREGYCSRPVCLSVYPSVPALATSASVETSKQRYSRVSLRLFLDFDSWIFEKNLP